LEDERGMRKRAVFTGLVMLLMVLSAFAALPAKTASAEAAEEDVLYIAMQADMLDFNYWNLASNTVWKANVIGFGFESLATADFDLRPTPLLAESWTFDEDTLEVDITLRQGVKWHDGADFTSEDVYWTYMMGRSGTTYSDNMVPAFDQDGDGALTIDEVDDGIQITGDYSLTMTMAEPYGQFFSGTLGIPIMPYHIWEEHIDLVEQTVDVNWGDDPMAAIGTGPWYYAEGVTNSYRVMKKFDDYWGIGQTTNFGMPLYPNEVDTLFYKIYASIDTAILALQGGQVDYIAWAVTAGRVPSLQSDPNIELEYMSDAGYFYMAFNQKREPMNNLTFRKAMSHLIDKATIVDTYMGGFGQEGSTPVSPFFGEWHNDAATKYAYDVELASDLLDEAGYDDVNGDGWREMPDGSLMDKITLLTPPADYDPIRIRAGQMIATNMREVGINVEAKPIDFNTLVAKMTAFDYQMLILGFRFTGYTECVSVLFDIFGATAGSNNWAWWSDANPNPLYSELGGVSTLADEASQDYVDEFAVLEEAARASFDVAEQIDLVKQGQEIVAKAVPANILYYRVNVEAHNKIWTNWTQFDGTLINWMNLNTLVYSEAGGATGGGAVATLSAGLTVSEKVMAGESVDAYVKVINNLGNPVAGANVDVTIDAGATESPGSGTTNADGVFEFSVTGDAVGISVVTVDVTSGTLNANDSASIRVNSLGGIAVTVTPEMTVLAPGDDIDVDLMVTDVNGDPVAGANVTIDPYLLGYGTISPSSLVTGATGKGTMVYSAPDEAIEGQHMQVILAASVSHPQYTLTNFAASTIMVYNDAAPDWVLTSIDSVTTTALDPTANETTITVLLTDDEGTAMDGETLNVVYSDESLVVDPVTEVTTAGDGTAEVVVTMADTGESGALRVTIGEMTIANSVSDTVTLTYVDPADPLATEIYGGYIQYAAEKYIDALGSVDVTVYVFDSNGDPADGVNATVIVPATSYGQMVDWADSAFNTLWEWLGLSATTEVDGQSISTAGSFASQLDDRTIDYVNYWYEYIPVGVTIESGVYDMTLEGVGLAGLDLVNSIHVMPGSWGWAEFDGDEDFGSRGDDGPWPLNFYFEGQTMISSDMAYGRAMEITTVIYDIEKPVLEARDASFDTTRVTVTVYDENNDPIEGADVSLYTLGEYGVLVPEDESVTINWRFGIASNTSDGDGMAGFDVVAASQNEYADTPRYGDITRAFDGISRISNPDMYLAGDFGTKMTLLSQTQLVIEPFRDSVYIELDPMLDVYMIGEKLHIEVTVVDDMGVPYPDLPVTAGVGAVGEVVTPTVVTDGNGMATIVVDTSGIEDAAAAMVSLTLATGGAPEGCTAKVMVAVQNMGPDVEITAPTADGELEGPDPTVTGAAYDMNGIARITLQVDDETPMNLTLTAGSEAVAISKVLEDVGEGEHTLTVVATDSLGVSSEVEVTFTVVKGAGEADMLAWAVAAIGWIVAAVVLVLLLMKMRKPKESSPVAMEEIAPAPEPEEEPVV
jgi:peptide/nickel transport system substrate-binding protein